VIVADSTPGAQAAKNATSTIPIVLALVVDPVGSGLVKSLLAVASASAIPFPRIRAKMMFSSAVK
jgi:hypothetical protein